MTHSTHKPGTYSLSCPIDLAISEYGKIDKTRLLDLHWQIKCIFKQGRSSDISYFAEYYGPQFNSPERIASNSALLGLDYGYYICRVFTFIEVLQPVRVASVLDMFMQDVSIKINITSLMNYISIAREYIPIQLSQKQNIICPKCEMVSIIETIEGEFICNECGFVYDTRLPGIKDLESVNTCRSYYSLKANLLKAVSKFEGKCTAINKTDLDRIKKEVVKRRISLKTLKGEHIGKILKDLKLIKYYDDVYSILMMITNKSRKSIQEYIPQILKLHDELEYAYSFVKNPERINSLNVHFKLYKLLRLCNVECDISDFCTLKTEQKYEEHEEKWREICKLTGWSC